MQVKTTRNAGEARIAIDGRFDFGCRHAFREACGGALEAADVTSMVIDLGRVVYLDSAALGMLLLVRDRALVARKPLSLVNDKGVVGEVLRVARFDQLFTMH